MRALPIPLIYPSRNREPLYFAAGYFFEFSFPPMQRPGD
jgi:hypothetical protein